jgi:prophage maintenance system killer protein
MLELNGYRLRSTQQEFEVFAVYVATDHPPVDEIATWLCDHSSGH